MAAACLWAEEAAESGGKNLAGRAVAGPCLGGRAFLLPHEALRPPGPPSWGSPTESRPWQVLESCCYCISCQCSWGNRALPLPLPHERGPSGSRGLAALSWQPRTLKRVA